MQCGEFDALLSQAIDGTLAGERRQAFEAHARVCHSSAVPFRATDPDER